MTISSSSKMLKGFLFRFLVLLVSTGGLYGDKLPLQFKKCHINDIECLKDSIEDALPKLKDGIPSLGVPSLDPVFVPEMEIGGGPSVVKLTQKYKNCQYIGVSNADIHNVIFDLDKGKLIIDWSVEKVSLNGTYEVNGHILSFPVYGDGSFTINIGGFSTSTEFDIETFMRKNETHIRGTHGVSKKQDATSAYFYYDNLFGGNKELGDNINKILNENWRAIFDELINGYTDVFAQALMNIMNRLFYKVPMSEIFLS